MFFVFLSLYFSANNFLSFYSDAHGLHYIDYSSPPIQLEQKVVASEIFKDKKDNYPQSVPRLFINTRLGEWFMCVD